MVRRSHGGVAGMHAMADIQSRERRKGFSGLLMRARRRPFLATASGAQITTGSADFPTLLADHAVALEHWKMDFRPMQVLES